jgi:short-subunit dehydrogenase
MRHDRSQQSVVLITGASSGIGAALAREYAHRKSHLVLLARRIDRLQSLAQELERLGSQVLVIQCDVNRDGDLDQAVQKAVKKFGQIDVVIANAGFGVAGFLDQLTFEDYRRQMETNVFGVLRTIYATLGELKKSHGQLVLLGSIAGYISLPGSSPYGMSKFAIHALAQSITPELKKDGVSVTLIAPGFVESEFRQVDNLGHFVAQAQDPIPRWVQMPTDRAAKKMIRAIDRKKPIEIITAHGKVIVLIQRYFPGVVPWLASRGLKVRSQPKKTEL